ncbi:MAG TPA: hypothetical protein VN641_20680 [Urbifossiella sp.]|nr:hypothetical protein [Urbifossiella sp.]
MNNMCPTCGAIYNVAAKDVGRRIKCKKCEAALIVGPNGLEPDDGATVLPSRNPPQTATIPEDDFDMEPPRKRRDRDRDRRPRSSLNPAEVLARIGGVSTLIFGFGAFLVIVFLFLPIIGNAAVERVSAAKEKVEQERDAKIKALLKGKRAEDLTTDERTRFAEDSEKIRKDYEKRLSDADDDARYERTSNKRSRWVEMYGMMFGFLFLMVGSIGYMNADQSLFRRILGTVVLGIQMIVIFIVFSTIGGCGKNAPSL